MDEEPGTLRPTMSLPPPELSRRWKPWSPRRVVGVALAFGLAMALLIAIVPRLRSLVPASFGMWAANARAADPIMVTPAAAVPPGRADATLDRAGRSPVSGGLLVVLPDFDSSDGAFDLIVHFHGNVDLTIESYGAAKLNAVLVVMNLGVGSGPYEQRFWNQVAFPELLERATGAMKKRGLANASLRRVALAAWSAGYGAVERTLEQPALVEKIDSVILLDGIHVGFLPKSRNIDVPRMEPFVRFARLAADGQKLFSITHSNIVPMEYAGTRATTDALLKELGIERQDGGDTPPMPDLAAAKGVVAKKNLRPLVADTHAERGGLIVRGYKGDKPENHISHLLQMSVTALPDLAARWAR